MLKALGNLPDGVLGFEAVGQVTADDYVTQLVPAIEAAVAAGPVRLVYVLGDRLTGFSAVAVWQDTRAGLDHRSGWERLAQVTHVEWVAYMAGLFGWMVPGGGTSC